MKQFVLILVGAVMMFSGCKTVDVGSEANVSSTVGGRVEAVMKAHGENKMRFFDPKGKELKEMPKDQSGTVSIYNKEMTGQDNYEFDKKGVISKHQRSYGEDYGKGIWKEVK